MAVEPADEDNRAALVERLHRLPPGRLLAWAQGRVDLNALAAKLGEAEGNAAEQVEIAARWLHYRRDMSTLLAELESPPAPAPEPPALHAGAPSLTRAARLGDLLGDLFEPNELRGWLERFAWGEGVERDLETPASRSQTAQDAAAKLVERGLAGPELFQALAAARPGRAADIEAVARAFAEALEPDRPPAPPPPRALSAPASPWALWLVLPFGLVALGGAALHARVVQPDPIPLTVLSRGDRPLGEVLTRLRDRGARSVMIDGPLDAAHVGAGDHRAALDQGLRQLNAAGVLVIAESAGDANLYPQCGAPPCLDGLVDPLPQLDPVDASVRELGPSFDACVHGQPTAASALETLMGLGRGDDLPRDWATAWCRVQAPMRVVPSSVTDRPWRSSDVGALFAALPGAGSPSADPIANQVVLVALTDDTTPRLRRKDTSGPVLSRAEFIASLAWSLAQR